MTTLTKNDIHIVSTAAEHFTRLYYTTYDSSTRADDLPNFYRDSSAVTWNGTPFQGKAGVRELLSKMPPTKHEVQSFDCHPVPGAQPPSLMVSVSGNVTHGKGPAGNPAATPAKSVDGQPRVFHQTFMLVPDPATVPGEPQKYYVNGDILRFVG
ncbi:NTF2-like protein [Irpex rosettiformis]|uniref:NTF2-like protein n=1 Tax=Irpex rosettiformis TaxID=378272 RepID=A0ACB8UJU4_9APHY|nr:NTF2-like protein [Irpex rosettiformis]